MTNGIARFKELCLDVYDGPDGPSRDLGRFWAAVTGCEYKVSDDPRDPGDVVGTEEGMGIAICPVPEKKADVKHRVHLDINTDSVDSVLALGATVQRAEDDEIHWTVMEDPEGGEFCAFVRDPAKLTPYRTYELVVDTVNAASLTDWWAEVFGATVHGTEHPDWRWLEDVPGMPFEAWVFSDSPEPKTVKNRWHWDVYGDVEEFLARGATKLWEVPGKTRPIAWTVLADPEGNEFCVFPES
ncbi:MAG: hypothetical protein J7518_18765 [Nocardioidaceae bacterium]|nr:hypothetical protein [Nocardioidaceae bacterium]